MVPLGRPICQRRWHLNGVAPKKVEARRYKPDHNRGCQYNFAQPVRRHQPPLHLLTPMQRQMFLFEEFRGGITVGSYLYYQLAVLLEQRVGGYQMQRFTHGLRDQQAVEGIGVVEGQD